MGGPVLCRRWFRMGDACIFEPQRSHAGEPLAKVRCASSNWKTTMNLDAFAARLVADTPDGILYADQGGVIQYWNAGCQRIFGFGADEVLGQSLDIIIPQNLRTRHWQGYRKTMRTGETRYGAGDLLSVPALRKDGARISVEFSIVPFRDGTGAMVRMAAVMRDVTKRFEELKALRKSASGPSAT
jgi:PAS domain S-box-containing protein